MRVSSNNAILQELEALEVFVKLKTEAEIHKAANDIFNMVRQNVQKLENSPEQHLVPRFMAILNRINKYLAVEEEDCSEKIKIFVCYYQPWELPAEKFFVPVQAGKAASPFDLNMLGDNTGDNISHKNATFSEFTAWYWVWKNAKKLYPNLEYIGLAHYRRYFSMAQPFCEHSIHYVPKIPSMKNFDNLFVKTLENADIILRKPTFFSRPVKEQYSYRHYEADYLHIKQVIHDICPEYDEAFAEVFDNNNGISTCCMFVAKYELFDHYFQWLFSLLFETERRIDTSLYDDYQKRVLAFLAERLLSVYVLRHKLKSVYEPIFLVTGENV